MTKKASTKKSHVKVNPRVSDVYEDTEGFTGQATSHRGVVIRKAKGGFEAPRYGLSNYRSLGAIKAAIEKLMKEKEGATTKDAEGNEVKAESCESSKDQELYTERYRTIINRAKDIILSEMPYQVYGSPDGKKEKKIGKPVKSGKYAAARAAELEDTHRATGGRSRAQKEEVELDEATRAAKEGKKDEHRVGVAIRAKQAAKSLAAKKARQAVLDAHEKKTGKKLDISKSPEGKTHAKHFGGSRQAKKVKGEKETPAETHNRRVGKNVARIVKHGYTSKEKKEVQSMAKHTSRYD